MTRQAQKDKEMEVAQFFIDRLNAFYEFDYVPESNPNEVDDFQFTDVFARSKKHEDLLLQLVTSDGDYYKTIAAGRRERERTGDPLSSVMLVPNGNGTTDPIRWMIEHKKEKTTGKEILLVHEEVISVTWNPEGAKRMLPPLAVDSPFKAVFLVILPTGENVKTTRRFDGQVIALKNIFGLNGESF